MNLKFQKLSRKDENTAIGYAITGMHFDWYFNGGLPLKLFGRYYWYLESNSATQVIALYQDDTLAGFLLAQMNGEAAVHKSLFKTIYVKIYDFIAGIFFKKSGGLYEDTNDRMLAQYCETGSPDGEIRFLAVNPDLQARGIGTLLLQELAQREPGKKVYLFTDSACTWQFYEHRGFEKAGEENIVLDCEGRQVPLDCFLYVKVL